jgi:hypothetical protein
LGSLNRLLPQHLADLRKSGLTDATIAACGFYSLTDPLQIRAALRWRALGNGAEALGPCLAIPFHDLTGAPIRSYLRLKPDRPRVQKRQGKPDKPVKYESPRGKSNLPYIPPPALPAILDPTAPLVITEGEKKAAAATQAGFACIGLVGVYGWIVPKRRPYEPVSLIPDLAAVPWERRPVFVVFDSDAADNSHVQRAERRLAQTLDGHGAAVRIVRLPPGPIQGDGRAKKVGLDDFLFANSPAQLRSLFETSQVCGFFADREGGPFSGKKPRSGPLGVPFGEAAGRVLQPVKSRCPGHYVPLLQSRSDFRQAAALERGCGSLGCYACSCRRKRVWLIHLICRIHEHRGGLWLWKGGRGRPWRSLTERLRAKSAEYARVDTADGQIVAIITANRPGATLVSPADAVELLAGAVERLGHGRKPIGASNGWKLAERDKSRKWKRRGHAPRGSFTKTMAQVYADGLNPQISEPSKDTASGCKQGDWTLGKVGHWHFPRDWSSDEVEDYFFDLGEGGGTVPIRQPQPQAPTGTEGRFTVDL